MAEPEEVYLTAIKKVRELHRRDGSYCLTCQVPISRVLYPCRTEEVLREVDRA